MLKSPGTLKQSSFGFEIALLKVEEKLLVVLGILYKKTNMFWSLLNQFAYAWDVYRP